MAGLMKRAIADYLQGVLADNSDLDDIHLFIRGGTPMPVPSHQYPYCEIIVSEEGEGDEMTGNAYSQTYAGQITVNVQLTVTANADWLEPVADRYATLPSYDLVEELVSVIVAELQSEIHKDLAGLIVGDEVVTAFRVTGPRLFGLDGDARTNNFENIGSIPFVVETEREV